MQHPVRRAGQVTYLQQNRFSGSVNKSGYGTQNLGLLTGGLYESTACWFELRVIVILNIVTMTNSWKKTVAAYAPITQGCFRIRYTIRRFEILGIY